VSDASKAADECRARADLLANDLQNANVKILELQEQIVRLSETDQAFLDKAIAAETERAWGKVVAILDQLLGKWPNSSLAPTARKKIAAANEELAAVQLDEAERLISVGSDSAKQVLEGIVRDYPKTKVASKAKASLGSLSSQIAKAKKKREAEEREQYRRLARAGSVLEVTAFGWSKEYSYAIVEGAVKNISSQSLRNVEAVAIFEDKSGGFITSDSALIEYNPILAGQSSPFRVGARWNPAMATCRIEFKQLMGGELPVFHSWR